MRKMLFKARYLKLISPITSNSNLNGPDLGEGIYLDDNVIRVYLFIYFTDIFNYSLDCTFFVDLYEHFYFIH